MKVPCADNNQRARAPKLVQLLQPFRDNKIVQSMLSIGWPTVGVEKVTLFRGQVNGRA